MELREKNRKKRRRLKVASFVLIVVLSTLAGSFCAWRLPGLAAYSGDWLMRSRGLLTEPDDIVIVAIDEPSIAKLGRFPWSREYTAKVLGNISKSQPKAIALDILFSEPTEITADQALAGAIKSAGNVVVSEQLVENRDTPELSRSEWLRSISQIETSAAGVGHVNVETEADGAARELLLRVADDEGQSRWALALETIRVADGKDEDEISQTYTFIRLGLRKIPLVPFEHNLLLKTQGSDGQISTVEPPRMMIDYIGPTGSFAAQTYSFSDVLEGKIDAEKFHGKYVLIGATAATLGDRLATPFVHTENLEGDQHGDLMPGVEILANQINTILRERFYRPVSDLTSALFAALTAIAVIFLLTLAEGRHEGLKQIGVLAGLLVLIVVVSYLVFANALIIPPMVPVLTSFAVASPLALLRRSLSASVNLDERISELIAAGNLLFTNGRQSLSYKTGSPTSDTEVIGETDDLFHRGKLLPHGLEWKTDAIGHLSREVINRAMFIDAALRSINDGLVIADRFGEITFANQTALRIFNVSEYHLIGTDVFAAIAGIESKVSGTTDSAKTDLDQLVTRRNLVEREIVVGTKDARYFLLRMGAVVSRDNDATLGIIATLSDVTYHRELQKTKNDVITLVTHELRTPLTAIQGMSEVLNEHEVDRDQQRKMLVTINSEAKRLAKMVNEYLDVTRLEAHVAETNLVPVDLVSLIDRTLLLLEPVAAKRDIEIVRKFGSVPGSINADPERFAQMLTNIVANAIKYSPAKTDVTVETRVDGENLRIDVQDHGYGIASDELPNIFRKFYRAPRRAAEETTGTGLGLALAKEIAELHGGHISVLSEVNKGSLFMIFLPISCENTSHS